MSQQTKTVWQSEIAVAVTILGHAGIATALGYPDRRNVWPWSSGVRMLPSDQCPAIERATLGKCRCERLNPDTKWVRIPDDAWPHPEGRPLIDPTPRQPISSSAQQVA